MGEQRAAHAAATQKPASDEEPEHPALSTSAFRFVVLVLAFVLAFLLAALTQNMGEDRAANTATTQYPAADQKAEDAAMIFVFALVFVVLVLAFVLALLLAMLAHEVRKKQAADAGATQQSACDQEFQDTMLLIASLLAFFAYVLAFFAATAFAQQVREKQTPRTPTAQAAADCQFLKF
jgi:ABC-type Fe3+ transport system permease subunit